MTLARGYWIAGSVHIEYIHSQSNRKTSHTCEWIMKHTSFFKIDASRALSNIHIPVHMIYIFICSETKHKKTGHTLYLSKVVASGVVCDEAMPTYTEANPCKLFNISKLLQTGRHSLNSYS